MRYKSSNFYPYKKLEEKGTPFLYLPLTGGIFELDPCAQGILDGNIVVTAITEKKNKK